MLGQGIDKMIVALVTVQWAYYARTVRGAALVERAQGVHRGGARASALPPARIVFRHLLPNCLPPLIVVATVQVAAAPSRWRPRCRSSASACRSPSPRSGLLIANGFQYMLSGKYWISFFPASRCSLTIVSINLVGDQLRDVLNPRLQR